MLFRRERKREKKKLRKQTHKNVQTKSSFFLKKKIKEYINKIFLFFLLGSQTHKLNVTMFAITYPTGALALYLLVAGNIAYFLLGFSVFSGIIWLQWIIATKFIREEDSILGFIFSESVDSRFLEIDDANGLWHFNKKQ